MAASTPAETTITITGAGGQIGYALLFRIAAGDMLGPGRPVRLRLLEIARVRQHTEGLGRSPIEPLQAAEGAALELQDCAFALLRDIEITDDPLVAFEGCSIAMLVGARPRGPGMERADLLAANAGIFGPQGAAINAVAADDVRIVAVGNPANTNALIAAASAPDVPAERFTALTRLDHNRAVGQLSQALDAAPDAIERLAIWGNHSATQFPDVSHALLRGEPAIEALSARLGGLAAAEEWLDESFIPRVARRGAEIIEVRGSSSVASAANAAIEHVRDEQHGTAWTSAAVVSTGEYGVPAGLVSSFPVFSDGDGDGYRVIEGLAIGERERARIDASVAELVAERDAVRALGLV